MLRPCRWVHTIGMRFPIDVAYLDDDGVVVKTIHMSRHRVGIPVWRARVVIEAEAGAFGRWGLHVGDVVEVRDDDVADRPRHDAHPDTGPDARPDAGPDTGPDARPDTGDAPSELDAG